MTIAVSTPNWDLDASMPPLMLANLSHLGLIKVVGEQGRSFIHGQVTADISSLEANQWRWGAHCDPKGKMLASFRTFAMKDALLMLMPKDTIAVDLPQLQKYAVFSKATLSNASEEWCLLGVAGEQANQFVTQHFGKVAQELTLIEHGAILKDADRFILILQPQAARALAAEHTVFDTSAWQALEIAAGYPNLAPSHANPTSLTINLETSIEIALEDGYRKGGQIIEFVQRGNQVLLTAVLANDTENDTKLRFAEDEQSSLTVQPLPYSLDEA